MLKSLNLILHRKSGSTLPDSSSNPNLADKFADYFPDKISRICSAFLDFSPLSIKRPNVIVPNFSTLATVSEDDERQIIMHSPTKYCLLDPILTFLVKEYLDILFQPITRMLNFSY